LIERDECIDWIPDTLGRLRAAGGVFYVRGNHDLRVDQDRLQEALAAAGLIHVGGRAHQAHVRGAPILLAGNELPWYAPAPQTAAIDEKMNSATSVRILLTHSPDQFAWARRHGFDLVLAGHNHGGQVRLPLFGAILAPSRHGVRYACGVFRAGQTVLHVSRGTSSLTPLRLNCPPEIALLVLQPNVSGNSHQPEAQARD
jgi:predicted MPP superfamily phosphohydrolase